MADDTIARDGGLRSLEILTNALVAEHERARQPFPAPADGVYRFRPGDQQLPVPNDGPSMHNLVIADLEEWAQGQSLAATEAVKALLLERKRIGLERYGSILQAGNGRSWRRDLSEELADAAVYAMQGLEEDGTPDPLAALSEVYTHILSALFWVQRIPGGGND